MRFSPLAKLTHGKFLTSFAGVCIFIVKHFLVAQLKLRGCFQAKCSSLSLWSDLCLDTCWRRTFTDRDIFSPVHDVVLAGSRGQLRLESVTSHVGLNRSIYGEPIRLMTT